MLTVDAERSHDLCDRSPSSPATSCRTSSSRRARSPRSASGRPWSSRAGVAEQQVVEAPASMAIGARRHGPSMTARSWSPSSAWTEGSRLPRQLLQRDDCSLAVTTITRTRRLPAAELLEHLGPPVPGMCRSRIITSGIATARQRAGERLGRPSAASPATSHSRASWASSACSIASSTAACGGSRSVATSSNSSCWESHDRRLASSRHLMRWSSADASPPPAGRRPSARMSDLGAQSSSSVDWSSPSAPGRIVPRDAVAPSHPALPDRRAGADALR